MKPLNGYGSWFCEGKAWMNRDDRDLEGPSWIAITAGESALGISQLLEPALTCGVQTAGCSLQRKNGRQFFCNARSERISMHLINSAKRLQHTWRSSGRQYEPIAPNRSKGKNDSQRVTAFTAMRWGTPCLVMLHPEIPSLRRSKPVDVQWPSRKCVLLYEWLLQSFFVLCFLQVQLEIYHYGRAFLVAC